MKNVKKSLVSSKITFGEMEQQSEDGKATGESVLTATVKVRVIGSKLRLIETANPNVVFNQPKGQSVIEVAVARLLRQCEFPYDKEVPPTISTEGLVLTVRYKTNPAVNTVETSAQFNLDVAAAAKRLTDVITDTYTEAVSERRTPVETI